MSDQKCRGCDASGVIDFFDVASVPANVGTLAKSKVEAGQARQGAIMLVACPSCGLIQNQRFDVGVVGFEPGYEVSLFHTPTFRRYIQSVVDRLIDEYSLHGKEIFEIGCGGGDFLKLICKQGANRGVGVDPTVPNLNEETFAGGGSVQLMPGFFGPEHKDQLGDFVCCLSVFEDVPYPLQFLQTLRDAIGDKTIGIYFEVFNGFRAIEVQEVWSIHYEQCNYFRLDTLVDLFVRAGFEVTDSGACYEGDQYLFVEAKPAHQIRTAKSGTNANLAPIVKAFKQTHTESIQLWTNRLSQWKQDNETAVLWGSGGKGISFLTALPSQDCIPWVVDVNPDRQGNFIPLSGQEIVAPERLKDIKPNYVIISNPLYESEIRESLKGMGLDCEILVA